MDNPSLIVLIVWLGLTVLVALRLGYKFYKNHYAKPITVSAKVLTKHTVEFFSKALPHQQAKRYVVNFLVKGKKKGLYVSSGLYHACREGEQGKLTYRGDTVISFQ